MINLVKQSSPRITKEWKEELGMTDFEYKMKYMLRMFAKLRPRIGAI